MAGLRVILIAISVNKMYKKGAKGVKFYIQLIIQSKWINCICLLLGRLLGSLVLCSDLFGRFILEFLVPERGIGLKKTSDDEEKTIYE